MSARESVRTRDDREDREARVLKDRARMLALVPEAAPGAGELLNVLWFSLGGEAYAIELGHIAEVARLPRVTPLPCSSMFMRGIISVRGGIFSLVDLRPVFGLSGSAIVPGASVILLRSPSASVGLLADEILELAAILLSDIQATLPGLSAARSDHIRGFTPGGLMILSAEKLLADSRLVVNETVRRTV